MTQLKQLRQARGLSREQVAAGAGISLYAIRSHELGTVNGVQTRTAEAVAEFLGVSTQALFFPLNTDVSLKTDIVTPLETTQP